MVHATTMTAVMADKDPPVFRDFLGIGRKDDTAVKQPQPSAGVVRRNNAGFEDEGEAEICTRASSGNSGRFETCSAPGILPPASSPAFPTSSDPGSGVAEGWLRAKGPGALQHHGVKSAFYKPETENNSIKRRDSPIGRESLQERLQMSVEALENSRPLKVARLDSKDDKVKVRSAGPTVDELRLSMQPPRVGAKGHPLLHTGAPKPELPSRISKKPERPRPNVGATTPARLSHLGMTSERASAPSGRESHELPMTIVPPAADEGSRTGIKGSPLGGLLNTVQPTQATGVSSGPANSTPRRLKVSCHSAGSDPMLQTSVRHQFPAPPSRQLTIFYGGQAHVFDEVPPEKANHIMQLAGSNGRSWSTTYSPRQTTSIANSASEDSLSALERERDKTMNLSHGGSVQNGLSTEVQTLLRGLAQTGNGAAMAALGHPLPDAISTPLSTEIQQASTDRVAANGHKRDNTHGRTVARATSCTDDINAKESLLQRGQRWM